MKKIRELDGHEWNQVMDMIEKHSLRNIHIRSIIKWIEAGLNPLKAYAKAAEERNVRRLVHLNQMKAPKGYEV